MPSNRCASGKSSGQQRSRSARSGVVPKQKLPSCLQMRASATNRRPQRRFACTDALRPVIFKLEAIPEGDAA